MIVHCDKCGETVRFKPCDKLGVESVFCDCGEELGEVRVIFVPRRRGIFRIAENSGDEASKRTGGECAACLGVGTIPEPDGPPLHCEKCDGTGMTPEDLEFIEVQKIDGKRADAIAGPRIEKLGFTPPKGGSDGN